MPQQAKPTPKEESDFMKALLADIGNTFSATAPATTPTDHTTRHNATPSQNASYDASIPFTDLKKNTTNVSREQRHTGIDIKDVDMVALCDGAEDWDWNDLEIDSDIMPSVSPPECPCIPPPPLVREKCTRCQVVQVSTSDIYEKRLLVRVELDDEIEKREVILKDEWTSTDVVVGDCINVLGEFTPLTAPNDSVLNDISSTILVTSRSNMLILHPDLLLSATTIANAPSCTRKPLLSLMLSSNAPSPPSVIDSNPSQPKVGEVVVWGNFLHEVMQMSLATGTWDKKSVEERIESVVRSPEGLSQLVKLGAGIENARSEVRARAGGLPEFSRRFIGSKIKDDGMLTDSSEPRGSVSRIALTTLHEVEEDIWSPTYGLKGKIDASVRALTQTEVRNTSGKFACGDTCSWTMPFEIKTGRAVGVLEHRAQTMLYTILMAERYGVEVPSGLLYYTQSEEIMRVPTQRNELKALLMARNELASYMMRKRVTKREEEGSTDSVGRPFLPPTIDDEYKCSKCYAVDGCMLYRKAVEGVVDTSSSIAQLYDKKVSHLTPAQCDFFKKWEALVSMEEQDIVRFRKELWTLTAEQRERKGRCFGKMMVQDYKHDASPGVPRMLQHVFRFVRESASSPHSPSNSPSNSPNASVSLMNGSISAGDAITVSIEPNLFAIARGFVTELEADHIDVGFDHKVDLAGLLKRTQTISTAPDKILCRLDKDEFGSGLGRIRDNLARLFYANGDTKRLSLIVDLRPPVFDDQLLPKESDLPPRLNVNQQDAVRKVLSAKDYAIILGMPGTGKTTTVAEIINVLVSMGKTVLLASYTHSAVDTILLKLDKADYPILRLGSLDKVHPDIHRHTLAHQPHPETIEQLERQILGPPVVATTCLSLDHPLFARRYFDVCIIDEASQVTLPTCLGPLRYADKFVLVGDHFQLPPLVRSREARAGGLDVSLFKRLVDAHPEAVVDLVYQYRMNSDIMLLSNRLIYNDRLRCGSRSVSESTLVLPHRSVLNACHTETCRLRGCWLEKLLDEQCKAVFVDTDDVPGQESRVGDLIQNEVEAKLVAQVTEALLRCGINQNQIGIISLYRQQIKLLSHLLYRHKEIELLTADRSQGRDKDCIIISMVKSNISGEIGDLLRDWRRINVSFTRARSKLIIFGSRKTLRGVSVLAEFFELMETKGWIISLERGADDVHDTVLPVCELFDRVNYRSKRRVRDEEDAEEAEKEAEPAPAPAHAAGKENQSQCRHIQKKAKKGKVDQGVLRGRLMLRDIVNDVS